MKFIIGKKIAMTQRFYQESTGSADKKAATEAGEGKVIPVTVIQAGPCVVTQVKTVENDGYEAVQLGFDRKKRLNKPLAGHLKGFDNYRYLREFRSLEPVFLKRGNVISVSVFKPGDQVRVTGTSKGKGFQGVVKRHGFSGSPASHGHKDQLRMPGSIGATEPAHVFKGTRMAGRMGGEMVSVRNLEIIEVDKDNNLLLVKGAVPGARNTLIL